ncbi:MAG: hypothetical protein OEU94_15195 [Aquincola sp.]|nr:hypothetical protein [Aquincola sp.]MDH5329729.1 hypothetical protein [Aquincola sp.]
MTDLARKRELALSALMRRRAKHNDEINLCPGDLYPHHCGHVVGGAFERRRVSADRGQRRFGAR